MYLLLEPTKFIQMQRLIFNHSLLFEHFFGFGKLKKNLEYFRNNYESKILKEKSKQASFIPIERIKAADFEDLSTLTLGNKPIVFEKAGIKWPCCAKWNFEFIKDQYGDDEAFLIFHDSNTYELTSLKKAIDQMQQDRSVNLRFQPLLQRHPELLKDINLNFYKTLMPKGALNANKQFFMARNKAFTPIHTAIQNLLFLQVSGEKEWIVYHPLDTLGLKPKVDGTPYFISDFDPLDSTNKFEDQKALQGYQTILKQGDILYLPSFWWHYVRNHSDCISVGFRWTTLRSALKSSWILTLLTFLSTRPPIWTTIKDKEDFSKVAIKRKGAARKDD